VSRSGVARTSALVSTRVGVNAAVRDRQADLDQDAYVFATSAGRRPSGDNIRNRVLGAAVRRANQKSTSGRAPTASVGPHAAFSQAYVLLAAVRTW
jgi:hypothetical protein